MNSTYGNVTGYVRCPENGNTGWATMNSLIMGLQHELGISPVVASFGSTTYSKFAALGDIGFGWDKNRNIVAVLEYGLWCKGYWAVSPARSAGGKRAPATRAPARSTRSTRSAAVRYARSNGVLRRSSIVGAVNEVASAVEGRGG